MGVEISKRTRLGTSIAAYLATSSLRCAESECMFFTAFNLKGGARFGYILTSYFFSPFRDDTGAGTGNL